MLKVLLGFTFLFYGFLFNSTFSFAQDVEVGLAKLSAQDEKRYREILATPVDESQLNLKKIVAHKEKEHAFAMLGESNGREQNLLAWSKIDPEGKWSLRQYWSVMGKFDDALRIGNEIINESRFPPSAVRIRVYVAHDYLLTNQIDKAKELLDKAESIIKYEFSGVRRGRADTALWILRGEAEFYAYKSIYLLRIGKSEDAMNMGRIAVEKSKEMLKAVTTLDSELYRTYAKRTATQTAGNIVAQQISLGQFVNAEWSLREALKVAKENGFNDSHMFLFHLLTSDIMNGTSQYKQALQYAEKSEKTFLNQGYQKASVNWMRSKSRELTALAGLNEWSKALTVLQDAYSETKGTLFEPKNTLDGKLIGLIQIKNNRIDDAISVLSEGFKNDSTNYGPKHYYTAISQGLLGVAYWKKGDLAKARAELESARTIINSPDSLSGDFSESAIQRKTNRFIFESYMQMLAQTAQNSPQDAETLFLLSDQVNSSSVQQALSEAAVRSGVNIPGLSDVIRKEQDAKNEMATLVTYIANQNAQQDTKQNPQVVEQMRKRLFELEGLRKGYKAAIQKGYPEYFQLIQPKAPSTQEIAKLLAEDEVFVSILPMAGETYVWGIDHKGQTKFHRSDWSEQKTNTTVDALRKTLDVAGLGKRMPKFDYQGAHAIYKAFFEPLGELTQGKKHMVVSTSSALAKLPFAVLQTQAFNGANPVDAPWLVKSMAVSHVPTASGWMSLKRFGKVPHSVEPMVAWGDPLFDGKAVQKMADAAKAEKADKPSGTQVAMAETGTTVRSVLNTRSAASLEVSDADAYLTYSKIPPLPETRDEVEELAKILGADAKSDLYLGANATRASVLKSSTSGQLHKKQVVVFATHGLLAGDLPNLSQPALAMAATANPADSPLLTLEDVLSLKLNADWVVLSACNTAGADGRAEEAMSGLARGFFFAGSRSLLVTHWSVESESAMQLTTNAFASYKKDAAMRRSEALRQSMLAVMKSPAFGHPAFWAPYALVGEGGR
jgi:CHAT domain-containing protein/Tfp pilus assembly protein PilF